MNIKEIIQRLQTAMDDARGQESHFESWLTQNEGICDAIDALKQLDKPEQEPVGSLSVRYHRGCKSMTNTDFDYNGDLPEGDYELYTTPPQRKSLTDEQINDLGVVCGVVPEEFWSEAHIEFARAIEAAHGIKGEA
jgi:hypothetical protein